MSVELPFAPVDSVIRRHAGDLRVSADAAEELARRVQSRGATLAAEAADRADAADRKTLMVEDFEMAADDVPDRDDLTLPVAPVDRIARLDIPPEFRVSMDARVALASVLEDYATEAAEGARTLAEHAGRRTVQAEDIEAYFDVVG